MAGAMTDSLQKIYLFSSRGERTYFFRDSLSPSPSSLGATLKGKNLLPKGANSILQEYSQICSDSVSTIKVKNKNDFFNCQRGMEICNMSGNFEVDDSIFIWLEDGFSFL